MEIKIYMKEFKRNYLRCLFLVLLAFGINNCASKKKVTAETGGIMVKSDKEKIEDKKILYIVDGKEVPSSFIKSIDTADIESVTVIKGEKDVAKYTDKKYDGVIIIKMKK